MRKVEEALGEMEDVSPGQLAGMFRTFAEMAQQGLGHREGSGEGKETGPQVVVNFVKGGREVEQVEGPVVEAEFREAGDV